MSQNPHNSERDQPVLTPAEPRLRLSLSAAGGQTVCETGQAVTLIGSRRDCHLPVNDPNVSKVHCAVLHTGHGFLACDLCSRGGTYLNAAAIRVAPLRAGDRLQVGTVAVDVAAGEQVAGVPADNSIQGDEQSDSLGLRVDGNTLHLFGGEDTSGADLVDLTVSAALLGRRSTCDVIANTPDVSLVHAVIFAYHNRPVIADLGSRSGTLLNGQRVHLAWLRDGDDLDIGGHGLRIRCDQEVVTGPTIDASRRQSLPMVPLAHQPTGGRSANDPPPAADNYSRPLAIPDANAVEALMQVVLGDLTTARARLDERAAAVDKRQAELDTWSALLKLQSEHIEQTKADLARREEQLEQALAEVQRRLDEAAAREQAVTAA